MSALVQSPGKKSPRDNPRRQPTPPRRRRHVRFENRPVELFPAGGGYRVIRRPTLLDNE